MNGGISNDFSLLYIYEFLQYRNYLRDITFAKRKEKTSFSEPNRTRTILPLRGEIGSLFFLNYLDATLISNVVKWLCDVLSSVLMVWTVYLFLVVIQDAETGKGIGCSYTG